MIFWKSGAVPPPGDPITNSANPARMKLAASVTMMSGTPDAVITTPVSVDRATVTTSTSAPSARHVPNPWSSIQSADRQLANTIIEPTDRSMPPEITTTPWAMATNARLIVPAVIVRISKSPNLGSCETRHSSRTTSNVATPNVQPWRRARRDSRDDGSGSFVIVPPNELEAYRLMRRPPRVRGQPVGAPLHRRRRAARRRCGRCGAPPHGRVTSAISRSSLVNMMTAAPSSANERTRS